jgi:hypothetical protein
MHATVPYTPALFPDVPYTFVSPPTRKRKTVSRPCETSAVGRRPCASHAHVPASEHTRQNAFRITLICSCVVAFVTPAFVSIWPAHGRQRGPPGVNRRAPHRGSTTR